MPQVDPSDVAVSTVALDAARVALGGVSPARLVAEASWVRCR